MKYLLLTILFTGLAIFVFALCWKGIHLMNDAAYELLGLLHDEASILRTAKVSYNYEQMPTASSRTSQFERLEARNPFVRGQWWT